ncbi:MAG: type 4a pilus biogenesis protein PilO [Desulfotomaculales bacterium]
MRTNLTLREKVLLGIVGGGIMALALYWLVLKPQYQAFAAARHRLAELEQQLAAAEAVAAREAVEREALAGARQRLAALKPLFETSVEDGSVLADIGLEAIRRGVAITVFKPGAVVKREHYLELPLDFTVEGNYPSVQAFLRKLENLPNVSEICYLDIRADGGEGDGEEKSLPSLSSDHVRARFTLVVYRTAGPGAELKLAEFQQWLLGRLNPFMAARYVLPLPGRVPMSAPVPVQPDRAHAEGTATQSLSGGPSVPVPPVSAGAGEVQVPK